MTWFGAFAAFGMPIALGVAGWLAVLANEWANRKEASKAASRANQATNGPATNRTAPPADPVSKDSLQFALAKALADRATMLSGLGRWEEALAVNAEALAHFRRAEPADTPPKPNSPGPDTAPAEQVAGA
jgi:hypothetical protein